MMVLGGVRFLMSEVPLYGRTPKEERQLTAATQKSMSLKYEPFLSMSLKYELFFPLAGRQRRRGNWPRRPCEASSSSRRFLPLAPKCEAVPRRARI